MKITEVSEKYQIPKTTLRYYEKVGLFNEVNRIQGVRIYKEKDIEKLIFILTLKAIEFLLKMIADFIKLQEREISCASCTYLSI